MTEYEKGKHTVYYHRYHIVWITKYRYKVLTQVIKERIREIIAQVSEEMNIRIVNGVISSDHLHVLVSIPPNIAVSEFVQRAKGRTSRRIQQEFPELKKRYWGKHFWGRGYFSTTSGHITDEVINASFVLKCLNYSWLICYNPYSFKLFKRFNQFCTSILDIKKCNLCIFN